jgi:hypothetical protein
MEELKLLIEAVAGLPTITLWVLIGYLIYKLAIIGSMYGVMRFAIQKFVEWKTNPKTFKIGGKAINETVAFELEVQVSRLVSTSYIHSSDVLKLKQALDIVLKSKND